MQADETRDLKPGPSGAGQDSGNAPQLSTKLRDKLNRLAKWRIDPSSIEFPEGTCEFQGGHATVSRGLLVSTSDVGSNPDESEGARSGKGTDGEDVMKKAIAVKKLKIEDGCDQERLLGLALREAGLLVELSHENVIELKGFVEDLSGGRIWLIFPWEEHGNLKDFAALQDWEIPERISLIDDVTRGVEYLHTRNPPIIHGDLKSINILVTSECRAVITDFGSARRLTKKDPDTQTTVAGTMAQQALEFQATFCASTNTMTLTGNEYTLRWAAPELLADDEPGLWSDMWSLGWIWYEPMVIPDPNRTSDSGSSRARSPALLLNLGEMYYQQNDYNNASRFFADALDIYTDTADSGGKAYALLHLAKVHRLRREYSNAITLYSEAMQICTDIGDQGRRADALRGLARVHQCQREYSKAITLYQEVIQIYVDIHDGLGRANALVGLAWLHSTQKDYNQATMFYAEAIEIYTDMGSRVGRANALWGIAEVHRHQEKYSQAVTHLSEALKINTDLGNRVGRAKVLQGLANVHSDQHHYIDATRLYEQAAEIFEEIGDTSSAAAVSGEIAIIHRQLALQRAENDVSL